MAIVLYKAPMGGAGKEEQTKNITLDLLNGNQTVNPDDGKVLSEVVILKPDTLVDSNIKQGVTIAGVLGTYAGGGGQPQLNAPTISRSGNTLTLTNPSTNGNFLTKYKLYDGNTLLVEINATGNTTYNLLNLGVGVYNLNARCCGNNFNDSNASNSVVYAIYTINSDLTNLTTSSSATTIGIGQTYTTTLTAINGKYLPNFITLTIAGEIGDYSYNNITGAISVPNVQGNIAITAAASDYSRLDSPVILYENDIITWSEVSNADSYKIMSSGIQVATTTLLSANLSDIFTEDGIYEVTVVAVGTNHQDSNPSNSIIYNVGVFIYGVSGLDLSTQTLTRTDSNEGKTYLINSSTGVITTDFDDVFVEQYVGDDLQQLSYDSSNNYWVDENNAQYTGNVFRKINKFYKQISVNTNGYRTGFRIAIANECPTGFYCPAYFTNEDGSEMDYHLIGVYKNNHSNSKLRSISGVTPNYTTGTNYQNYGKNASNTVINCFAKDWRSDQLICDLFMIIFATRNTQSIWTNWRTYQQVTGSANNIRALSQNGFNTSTYAPLFLGIEDIIGNGFEYISGIFFNGSSIYISKTPSTDNATITGKTLLGYTRTTTTSTREIMRMGYDANEPDCEYANAYVSNSSYNTYYCDAVYYSSSGTVLYKGASGVYAYYGLFCASGDRTASNSLNDYAARLCAQPL